MRFKSFSRVIVIFILLLTVFSSFALGDNQQPKVVVLSIKGDIEIGLAKYVQRALSSAKAQGVKAVVVDIDTFGGRIDAAIKIRDLLLEQNFPTYTFVRNRAWSAGALIALATDQIFMAPGSSIGAAEPREGISSKPADEKVLAALRSEFESTAERTGRDPQLAAAMVDSRIEIPQVVEAGQLLSLSAEKALSLNFIDGIKSSVNDLLSENNLGAAQVVSIELNWGERLSRLITHPFVSPLLLALGFFGLVFELFTPGWGVGGSVGLFSLALYFAGHIMAGVAGWEAVLLFVTGLLLILLEIFVVPGVGVTGILGFLGLVGSIFLTSTSIRQAVISLVVAFSITLIAAYFCFRYLRGSRSWSQLILGVKQDKQSGYTAHKDWGSHLGRIGSTTTPLRPAGTADFDGVFLDVVSEGNFVEANTKVRIMKVEGGKIIVRPVDH